VEGEVRHVFVEPGTTAKLEIPAEIRAALEPYAVAPATDATA
jgi:acyl-CoA thioesterase FadM